MLQKTFYWAGTFIIVFALVLVVGCSDSDKTLNSDSVILDDEVQNHDPPGEFIGVVTDTLIDYTDEIRAIAPWMLEENERVAYRLSRNPRLAIALEAILAITNWDWRVHRAIDGMAVSDWNYLTSHYSAYDYIKRVYQGNASVWPSYYNNPYYYGFINNSYGRGGQCRGFANLIWYRAVGWHHTLYSYSKFINDYNGSRRWTKPYYQARQGDIIQYAKNGKYHTAVVVVVLSGTEGSSVRSVDVVDANWVGGRNQEIIARHPISRITSGSKNGGISDLDQYIVIDCLKAGVR